MDGTKGKKRMVNIVVCIRHIEERSKEQGDSGLLLLLGGMLFFQQGIRHIHGFFETLLDENLSDFTLFELFDKVLRQRWIRTRSFPWRWVGRRFLLQLLQATAHLSQQPMQGSCHIGNILGQSRSAFLLISKCVSFRQMCPQLLTTGLQSSLDGYQNLGNIISNVFLSRIV